MFRRWRLALGEGWIIALLLVVSAVIFGAITYEMIFDPGGTDYTSHIEFALALHESGKLPDVHILYQALIIALAAIFPISFEVAAWMVSTAFYILTALILYWLLRQVVPRKTWPFALLCAGLALALLLVTPVTLLTIPQHNLYWGYVAINVYHNPTMVLLKPFALLLFVFSVAVLHNRIPLSLRTAGVGILLVAFGLLAKPNYVLVLLPALLVVVVYRLLRHETAGLKTLLVVLVAPMIVLLGLQYLLMYGLIQGGNSGIVFAPLASLTPRDPSLVNLAGKFMLSLLFPLAVYSLYFRKALRDTSLNLAWLTFFAGAGQMYLFGESGEALPAGNFWWGAQIGLFILFAASVLFWLRHLDKRFTWPGLFCLCILALHVVSGVIFYVAEFRVMRMFTWW